MNALFVIAPYRWMGMWVFDDPQKGLTREPFVGGADILIDYMVADVPDAGNGFTLLFSAEPFPGFQHRFDWVRPEMSGNVYRSEAFDREGWLCPALLKYFDAPPRHIYVQTRAKPG
jgi:hypothetical protein